MPALVTTVLIVMIVAVVLMFFMCCFGMCGLVNPFEQLSRCTFCANCCDCGRVCGWSRNNEEVVEVEVVNNIKPKRPPAERSLSDRVRALEDGGGGRRSWAYEPRPNRSQMREWGNMAREENPTPQSFRKSSRYN